jgi:hypothetical protein
MINGKFLYCYQIVVVQFLECCCLLYNFCKFFCNSKNYERFRLSADFVPLHSQKLAKFSDTVYLPRKNTFLQQQNSRLILSSALIDALCWSDVCYVVCFVLFVAAMFVL